jgi:hypothetical protein
MTEQAGRAGAEDESAGVAIEGHAPPEAESERRMLATRESEGILPPPMSSAPSVHASFAGDDYRLALEPNSFDQAWKLANVAARSGWCGVVGPDDALVRILTGRSLGVPAFVALKYIYSVGGKAGIEGKLKIALAQRHPECENFECIATSDTEATYRCKRKGRVEKKMTYTVEMARKAGLVKKDSGWDHHPANMCRWRAGGYLADMEFPEATLGLPTREELEEERERDRERAPAGALQSKVVQAAARDFDTEAATLKGKIRVAKSEADRKALRDEIAAFASDAGEPWASEIKKAYNDMLAAAKASKAQPAQKEIDQPAQQPPKNAGDAWEPER